MHLVDNSYSGKSPLASARLLIPNGSEMAAKRVVWGNLHPPPLTACGLKVSFSKVVFPRCSNTTCERMKIFDITSALPDAGIKCCERANDITGQTQNRPGWGISAGNTQAAVPAGQAATDGHDFDRRNVIK